jgi:hypothetical protein
MKTEKLPIKSAIITLLQRFGIKSKEQEREEEPQTSTPPKRKRGRPRKNPEAEAIDIVEPTISYLATSLEPAKRKRGRPRKVSNETKIEVIENKKRGRPRKKPEVVIEKKKRGRPSKYSPEVLEKRGKGRPRKYGIEILNQTEVKIVSVLISILEKAEKPVHTPLLLSQINKSLETSFAEPTLRRVINYIRGKSLSPIVCVNGTGYEITTSKRKIKEQIDSLNKRASSIVSSAHGLKKFL